MEQIVLSWLDLGPPVHLVVDHVHQGSMGLYSCVFGGLPPHVICVVLLVLLAGLLGAWDGLWRLHVCRYSPDASCRLPNISE